MLKAGKKIALILSFVIAAAQAPAAFSKAPQNAPMPFSDIEEGKWYTDPVRYVYENSLMTGTEADKFSPDTYFTRAQLVTVLWRMAGEKTVNYIMPFGDIENGAWYTEAIRWAAAEDIIPSKNAPLFMPDTSLDRDEAAALLWNYARYADADVSVGEDTNILSYNDFDDIREEYIPAVQWALGAGVIEGIGDGYLSPKGQLTRAEAAAVLWRYSKLMAEDDGALSLWTDDARAKNELISYINAVTDEASGDFIPEKDRIAVFDLDGTLFCETDPNYFDYTLLKYRVLEDPDYIAKASDFEKETANKIKEQNETGKSFQGLEVDHGRAVASAFSGMTVSEFNSYIQDFKKQPMPSYTGMNRGEGFYLPMAEVVDYLKDNGFTVYIVSGTDRLIVRGIIDGSILDIPNRQIIGSDETIISNNQGDTDGLDYVFKDGDELILGGDFIIKNLKMNKVSVIMQEIGQKPVLSFGNSTGDSSMAEFVTSNNPYKSLAFMLCCDDTERENGNIEKADKMYALCDEFDWVPVSMKNDWKTIYGESVIKK